MGLADFREGLCHADLNFSNVVQQPDGEFGLYDFESCGQGILAYDLAVFRWTQRLVGAPERVWDDFLDGYRRVNELPERELAGLDVLVLLRQLYMLEHDARRTQIESLGACWCTRAAHASNRRATPARRGGIRNPFGAKLVKARAA